MYFVPAAHSWQRVRVADGRFVPCRGGNAGGDEHTSRWLGAEYQVVGVSVTVEVSGVVAFTEDFVERRGRCRAGCVHCPVAYGERFSNSVTASLGVYEYISCAVDVLAWFTQSLSGKSEQHADQHSDSDSGGYANRGHALLFVFACAAGVTGVSVFGVDWCAGGSFGIAFSAAGLLLWFYGFSFVSLSDWRSGSFNATVFWLTTGPACALMASAAAGWLAGLTAGGFAALPFALERVVRSRGIVVRDLFFHGDIDMAFLAAFPVGASLTSDLYLAATTGTVLCCCMCVLKLCSRGWARGEASHMGMFIFFGACLVWAVGGAAS